MGMGKVELSSLQFTQDRTSAKLKALRKSPISQHTISIIRFIAIIAQWHIIQIFKLGLLPLRVSNYYLIKAKILDSLFDKLNENSIERWQTGKNRKAQYLDN
jgi:hypothetical protein